MVAVKHIAVDLQQEQQTVRNLLFANMAGQTGAHKFTKYLVFPVKAKAIGAGFLCVYSCTKTMAFIQPLVLTTTINRRQLGLFGPRLTTTVWSLKKRILPKKK